MDLEEASCSLKARVLQDFAYYVVGSLPGFGKPVGDRTQVKSLGYCLRQSRAIAVCEIEVKEDMLNQSGDSIHNGCIAYLIDMCTALPFILLSEAETVQAPHSKPKFPMAPFAPSQRLDLVFLNPAPRGTRLKIIARSIAHVRSALFVMGEVWDLDNDRLIAYATHFKVMPKSPPKAAMVLKL